MIIEVRFDNRVVEKCFILKDNKQYIRKFLNSILYDDTSNSKYFSILSVFIAFLSSPEVSPISIFIIFSMNLLKSKSTFSISQIEKLNHDYLMHIDYAVELSTIPGLETINYQSIFYSSTSPDDSSIFETSENSFLSSSQRLSDRVSLSLTTFISYESRLFIPP